MTTGDIYYGAQDGAFVVRFVGAIRYTMCCALDELLTAELKRPGLQRVFIDLRDADSVDSTSLGLLAKIANLLRAAGRPPATLLTGCADIREVLDSVGFDEIFDIGSDADGAGACPDAPLKLDVACRDLQKMADTVRETHGVLSDLNEKNRELFKDVIGALDKEPAAR